MNKVHYSSERIDWETPDDFFSALHAEFDFALDVCAHAGNHKTPRYFSPEDDGLAQTWRGRCWMNPPYGRGISAWIKKAHDSSREQAATVVCLVPARTDTRWWHEYVMRSAEVRFVKGRIKFVGATAGAPFPVAIVIFRFGFAKPNFYTYVLASARP